MTWRAYSPGPKARTINVGFGEWEAQRVPNYRAHAATRYLRAFDHRMSALFVCMRAWYTHAHFGVQGHSEVGRCRLTVLKTVFKAPMISALETIISYTAFTVCFQIQVAPLQRGGACGVGLDDVVVAVRGSLFE
jgi:hypothetical protein